MKKTSFTLAEVLITLGIIGVVAAMTLPALIQKKNDVETVSRLKKAYSVLSQAYTMATDKYGPIEDWGFDSDNGGMSDPENHKLLANRFVPFLKLSQNCIGMTQSQVTKSCTERFYQTNSYQSVILTDGSTIIFRIYSMGCNVAFGPSRPLKTVCGNITVDINGKKRPNLSGEDMFHFYITRYGILPLGTQEDTHSFQKGCNRNGSNLGSFSDEKYLTCAAWVIYRENVDYKYCDDLDWNGKKKCSN